MRSITESDISNLKKKGFINIKNFFDKDDITILSSEADKIYPNKFFLVDFAKKNKLDFEIESDILILKK